MARNPSSVTLPSATLSGAGDRVGMVGSVLCAVHCALLPVLVAGLPALGLGGTAWVDFDQAFVVFATLLGISTLMVGYRRHRTLRPWLLLLPGLALVWTGAFTGLHTHTLDHALIMVAGGLLIAAAHLANLRLGHSANSRPLDAQRA
jgi:hypothetical protein